MSDLDPEVTVDEALKRYVSQSALATALGVKKAWISQVVRSKKYLPPLLAHRYKFLESRVRGPE